MTTANYFDAWMSGYKALAWNQDQLETLGANWLSQARTMRHDGEKVLEVLVTQTRERTEEMQKSAQALTKSALEHVPAWDLFTQADLRKQVGELSARLDALSAK
jgi:hypothetical protein